MAVILSPFWMPACAAGLFATTSAIVVVAVRTPENTMTQAKIKNASKRLATGPAATIAARFHSGWCEKAVSRSAGLRSEEHTSELQSRFGISYAVFCLKKKK